MPLLPNTHYHILDMPFYLAYFVFLCEKLLKENGIQKTMRNGFFLQPYSLHHSTILCLIDILHMSIITVDMFATAFYLSASSIDYEWSSLHSSLYPWYLLQYNFFTFHFEIILEFWKSYKNRAR